MKIDNYNFGEMKINGTIYNFDLIVTPDKILTDWWREDGHSLSVNDFDDIIDLSPAILIIGRGAHGVMSIRDSVQRKLVDQGFEVITAKTGAAVEKFNMYQNNETDQPVIGAFHLTC